MQRERFNPERQFVPTTQRNKLVSRTESRAPVPLLLELVAEVFNGKSWHGPSLRSTVRRVSAAQAGWRPGRGRKCIAEIVLHAAYWKYAARRRLRGEPRGSFALKGSNWFTVPAKLGDAQWKEYLKLLDAEHAQLLDAIAELTPADLLIVPTGSRVNNAKLVRGIASHDVYHAGQIQTIKRLCPIQ
ncbi:MAG: hypothetical protein DCC66_03660 [Planctomycetota bacterium]|nr:MAG: hypothetical protein DCC66_03660 [Planctomycetota bacterium]